jgi:hypothetical protein
MFVFGGDATWTETCVTDFGHLPVNKTLINENCAKHVRNVIHLDVFGKANIAFKLRKSCR